jgi:DNA-binding CsgD family transcriptional regulator
LRTFIRSNSLEPLKPFASEFVKLVPELGTLLPEAIASSPLEPTQEKLRYFQTLNNFISAESRGSLIIIEDIHWCDDTSLEYLLHFAHRIANISSLLLLTYRNDELNPSLDHFLADLDRARLASEMALNRLSQKDVEAMIAAIFGQEQPVKPEFGEAIQALTDGNPFFIEETLKALLTSGDIYYGMGGWTRKPISELHIPRTVQDAVQRRVDSLGPDTQQLLILAAVAGRRFDFDLLQRLTQSSEDDLLRRVKELIAAQLVIEESEDYFLFRHALTRQALYSRLLVRERKALHRRITEALQAIQASKNHERLAELAYHSYEAGMWELTLHFSQEAGEKAQYELHTPRAAVDNYNRAFEAARQLAIPAPLVLFHERGQMHETLGEFELALADYEAELSDARLRNNPQSEWQALIDLGFLTASRDYAKAGDYFRSALAITSQLSDPAIVAYTLNRVGNWHFNLAQSAEALQYHMQAARIFESLNNKHGLAATYDLLGITYLVECNLPEYVAYYEKAITLFQELDDRGGYISSLAIYATRGADYLACVAAPVITPVEDRLRDGQQALDIAQQMGALPAETLGKLWLGLSLVSSGKYSQGLEMLRAGLQLAEAIDHRHFMTTGHMIIGAFYLDIFALPLAQTHLEQARSLAEETKSYIWLGMITAFLADTYTQQRNFAKADATLRTLLTEDLPIHASHERHLWRAKAEWHLAQGHAMEAFGITQRIVEHTDRTIPRFSLLYAESALALRRYATAQNALQPAREAAQALSLKPLLWRILLALGRVARAQSNDEQAEKYFAEGRALLDELAADLAMSDPALPGYLVQSWDRMKHARSTTARSLTKNQYEGLTTRERDVAGLIARGKSNKEIAETLVLSNRTVEAHIGRILAKLNFSSRAQIAVWAVEKGLLKT